MSGRLSIRTALAAAGLIVVMTGRSSMGQQLYLDRTHETIIQGNYINSNLTGVEDWAVNAGETSLWSLTGRFRTSKFLSIVVDVPHAKINGTRDRAACSYCYGFGPQASLGNPYIGLQFGSVSSAWITEIGIRLPLTNFESYHARRVGALSAVDRIGAFGNAATTLTAGGNYYRRVGEKFGIHFRGALGLLIPHMYVIGTSIILQYSYHLGYDDGTRVILTGIVGSYAPYGMSEYTGNQKTRHSLAMEAKWAFGRFQPGIVLQLPLNRNLKDRVEGLGGLSLAYFFGDKVSR